MLKWIDLWDYVMHFIARVVQVIHKPTVQAHNSRVKPAMVQMVQHLLELDNLPQEDPNVFLTNFLKICDTFKA